MEATQEGAALRLRGGLETARAQIFEDEGVQGILHPVLPRCLFGQGECGRVGWGYVLEWLTGPPAPGADFTIYPYAARFDPIAQHAQLVFGERGSVLWHLRVCSAYDL